MSAECADRWRNGIDLVMEHWGVVAVDGNSGLSYDVYTSTTITIRAQVSLREALAKKATVSGKTLSELVRQILEEAVADRPLKVRAGHLRGKLELPRKASEPWRERLRRRNWRS